MAQQTIGVGTVANDGTGDPLRTALQKVNSNFTELYTATSPAGANISTNNISVTSKLNIGTAAGFNFGSLAVLEIDATQNTYVQAVIQNANSGINASSDLVVTSDTGNDSFGYIDLGINSSTYSNASYTVVGALGAYLYSSNSDFGIGTASTNNLIFHTNGTLAANERMRIAANGNIGIGNTTPVNTLAVTGNVYVSQNTLSLGTSTNAANGYTYLPNGFKMNWGWVSANSSAGTVTFPSAYSTNAYVVTATSNSATATFGAAVIATNNSTASIRTANATSTNVFWTAIGY